MKGYVEKIIKDYPSMVRERERLKKQIQRYEFLSAEELISAMSFSRPDGERVQSSNLSDKTARIAILYEDQLEQMNNEILIPMIERLQQLDQEITLLQSEIKQLPDGLAELMQALVIEEATWDEIEMNFYLSRKIISRNRKRAIEYLVRSYQIRESQMELFLLS